MCRSFSKVLAGAEIDGKVGSLIGAKTITDSPLFSYARYSADLCANALIGVGLNRFKSLFALDSLAAIGPCIQIAQWLVENKVHSTHFDGFWTPPQ